jgi:hypothetical protein
VEAREFAAEKTEDLLVRAARHGWPVAQLQAHVRAATRPDFSSPEDLNNGAVEPTPAPPAARLYEDKGGRLTIWPQAVAVAAPPDRAALAKKLRSLLLQLEP